MAGDKGKRILIHLSSSDDDDDDADADDDDDDGDEDDSYSDSASFASEDECESIDDEDEDDGSEEDEEEEENDNDDDSFENGAQGIGDDDEEALYNRVIQCLQEKSDLRELSLKACKAYLRRHGLRVSGNKDVCMKRVKEHWRIKDGEVEALHPRSSFIINCTGDVCKGDIVLFTQKVYGSFDKVTRRGKLLGKRTVAGRVVKESYGAAKQQHTFTVEVLWSKGIKKLPPLFPLLIKGRNLYRLRTYRQPWKNETERRKVLAEKHRRGTAARLTRAKRKQAWSTDKGGKRQKVFHSTRQSQMSYSKRGKCVDKDQRASSSKHSSTSSKKQGAGAHSIRATCSKPFLRTKKLTAPDYRVSPLQLDYDASQNCPQALVGSHYRGLPFGSTFQRGIPSHHSVMVPVQQYNGFRPFFHNSHDIQLPQMTHAVSRQFFPSKTVPMQRQIGLIRCSIQGCQECGSDRCIIGACWRCCRREGVRCYVHR